jgi:hypothetical protein
MSMVRPITGAITPPPVPPPVQADTVQADTVPAPPVQPAADSESMAAAASPALPLRQRRRWRRPALAAALMVAAAFGIGRWSTSHDLIDELANLPQFDTVADQVIGEETQVVEVAAPSAAASPESSPKSVNSVSAVPVVTAPAIEDSRDINAEADSATVVADTSDKQPDAALAEDSEIKDPEIKQTQVSFALNDALNDEPNDPLLDIVAAANPQAVCKDGKCLEKRSFGTTLVWAETPDAAAELSQQQGKLVFIVQVSGNFAREEFT